MICREVQQLKKYPEKMSLLMIDIDNFKKYNDTHGHPAGDELLRKLAQLLKSSLRDVDIVFRYGGEEFVVILPKTDRKGGQIVAERLLVQVDLYLPTSISIGIAALPDDAETENELIEKADNALYEAKRTGKDRYCVA
jgi:diguanylate cyclase (GGDEF)-like protein